MTPNKPGSVYTVSEDLGYPAPVSPTVVAPTPSTGATGPTGSVMSTGALAAEARYLPNAKRKIQLSKLAVYIGPGKYSHL